MANIALYRRYRSKTFDELIGQEHVTEPLIAALRNGKLNHAYLFSGPRGCGKTSSARILARSVNCVKGPTPTPCGECESCRALAPDGPGSIDVIEIDAASHGGVDDARELREKAFFAPVSSRYKVYVIDEAHMVSSAGFNALLKLVEEPPEYVMFVFATTEPDKVLGTIKSRTHHYPFRLVPPGVMRGHLERVCEAEGVKVDPQVFPLVVRAGGGSVRDSMSILDQLLAGAGEEGVSYQHALGLLGVTDAGLIDQTCDALAAVNGAQLFAAVDSVVEAGHDLRRFASDLLERLRDLIVINQVPDAAGKGLLDVPADELERMSAQAMRLGPATLSRMADILHEGLTTMRGATSPRLVLELLCARMLLPGDDSAADLMQRMERLERRLDIAATAHPDPAAAPPASAPAAPPRATAPPAPAPAVQGGEDPTVTAPTSPAPGSAPASGTRPPAPSARAGQMAPAGRSGQGGQAGADGQAGWAEQAAPAGPAASAGPASSPAPAATSGGAVDVGAVVANWDRVVEYTKSRRRVVWSLLQNAAPYALDGDTLILNTRSPGLVGRFNDDTVVSVLQDALFDVLGVRWRIKCQAGGGDGGGGGAGRPGPGPSTGGPSGPANPVGPADPGGPAGPSNGGGPSSGDRPAPGAPAGVPRQAGGPGRSAEHAGQAAPPSQRAQTGQPAEGAQQARAGSAGPVSQAAPQAGRVAGESDWPETARPGGVAAPEAPASPDPPPAATAPKPPGATPAAARSGAGPADSGGGGGRAVAAMSRSGAVSAGVGAGGADGYGLPEGPTDFSPDDPVPVAAPQGMRDDEVDELLDAAAPDLPPPASAEDVAESLFREVLQAQPIQGIGG